MKMMKFYFIVAMCCSSGSLSQTIEDPLEDFYGDHLYREDKITISQLDMNADGVDEILITTDAPERNNAKEGYIWNLYISTGDGYVRGGVDDGVVPVFRDISKTTILQNGRVGIIKYHAADARSGSLSVLYLDEENAVQERLLGELVFSSGEYEAKARELLESQGLVVADVDVASQLAAVEDIYSAEKVSSLESRSQSFWENHWAAEDPSDPSRSRVYRNSDNELVGHYKGGTFLPLEEPKVNDESGPADESPDLQANQALNLESESESESEGAGPGKAAEDGEVHLNWWWAVGGLLGVVFVAWIFLRVGRSKQER